MNFLASIQLGEVEVPNSTLAIMIIFSSFTFLAVGISSFKLYKSLIGPEENNK
tara:strand:+ start:941 stop:1099 length:159 start_codon:yes stop_codon:yes gene_type:complete